PTGSRAANRLRRDGKIPAVLYGHGMDPVAVAVDGRDLRSALSTEAGVNALVTLRLDGEAHLAMARQLQRDPVRGAVRHIDFVIVRRDEVIGAEVPIHLVGEAEEVHRADGLVEQQLFALAIRALPGDIPPGVEVDISGMTIGDTVRVADIRLPAGVSTEVDGGEPVVVAAASRLAAEIAAVEEEAAPAAADVVARLAERHGGRLRKAKELALSTEVRIDGHRVALAWPQTYVNESGRSVVGLVRRHGVDDLHRLVVVHDELDLPVGGLKIKVGGGTAGHNGLKSIEAYLHDNDFVRVRIGVDKPPGRRQGADHVLK